MRNTLLLLAVIVVAFLVYRPLLAIASRDMAARTAAGKSNGMVYAVLLLPLVGPFVWLLVRRRFTD